MEPFKDKIDARVVADLAACLPPGRRAAFEDEANAQLAPLELKARIRLLAELLDTNLDAPFPEGVARLVEHSAGMGAWQAWAICTYIELFGLAHHDEAFAAMRVMTARASCEFAVRPYLRAEPERSLAVLHDWVDDPDPAVRRLVSEGTRPRLPWGARLRAFQEDPGPVVALLDRLFDDPAETVRRSVANSLNDISKDHADLAVEVARRWWERDTKETKWVVRHALRGLVKAGDEGALGVLGFGPPEVEVVLFDVAPERVRFGDALQISVELNVPRQQGLIVDYAVHHMKADGSLRPKVFKWRVREGAEGSVALVKSHRFRSISTRRYHAGEHRVELLINGVSFGVRRFDLEM